MTRTLKKLNENEIEITDTNIIKINKDQLIKDKETLETQLEQINSILDEFNK